MAEKLPDEILVKILSPILDVEDHLFADTSRTSPFSQRSHSTSAVLVVCQNWLRICTPLLYNVVILRSTAQAQALAYALMRNKFLGLFIKKLRLEGGFGASMRKILLTAPNITDLVLSLSILSQDSVVGLVKGLLLINPTRLILLENDNLANIHVGQLTEKLCDCVVTWTNLKSVDLALVTIVKGTILQALKLSQSIELLFVPLKELIIPSLEPIACIPTLQAIEVKGPIPPYSFQKEVEKHRSLVNYIRYQGQPPSHTTPLSSPPSDLREHLALEPLHNTNPFYSPMSSVSPDIQDVIWSRILEFALEVNINEDDIPDVRSSNPTRAWLPCVSKKFKDLTTPILYRYLIIPQWPYSKISHLLENPSLVHIRSLFYPISRHYYAYFDMKVISQTAGLVRLHSAKVNHTSEIPHLPDMDWNMFVAMAKTSGSTLLVFHNFYVQKARLPPTPSIFDKFTKLRSLRWCSPAAFMVNRKTSPVCLATLESIHFTLYHKTFADVLSCMELPLLSDIVFCGSVMNATPFLVVHGSKIRSLELQVCETDPIFDLCPNMTLLVLGSPLASTIDPAFFICNTEHRSLEKLRLNMNFSRKSLKNFYPAVDLSSFPALREIQAQFCVWPVDQREMALDSWHKWSGILSNQGIKLTDAHGRHWRPRLKKQPR